MTSSSPWVCQTNSDAELPNLSSLAEGPPTGCMESLDLSGWVEFSYQWLESAPIPLLPYVVTSLVDESIELTGCLDQAGGATLTGLPYGPLKLALGYELEGTEYLLIARQLGVIRSTLSHMGAVFSVYSTAMEGWLEEWLHKYDERSVGLDPRKALQKAVSESGFSYLAIAGWGIQVTDESTLPENSTGFPAAERAMSQLLRRFDLQAWDMWQLMQSSAITGLNAPLPGVSSLSQLHIKLFLGDEGLSGLFRDFLNRCWGYVSPPYQWAALELLVHVLFAASKADLNASWQSPLIAASEELAALVQPLIEQLEGLAELLVKTQLSRRETIYTQIPAIIQWQRPPKYRRECPTEYRQAYLRELTHKCASFRSPEYHQGDLGWPCNRSLLLDFQCDIASGSVHFSCVDFSIPGAVPLPWVRTYSSLLSQDTGMGVGWAWYGSELLSVHGDHVIWETADATLVYFELPEIGKYSTNEVLGASLLRDFQSVFRVVIAGAFTRLFNGKHTVVINEQELNNQDQHEDIQLSALVALSGYRINFMYHDHRLCELATSEGFTYRLRYDAGRVIALDDLCQKSAQHRTVIKYHYRGALLAEAKTLDGPAEFYGYDQHLLNRKRDQSGLIWHFGWGGGCSGGALTNHNSRLLVSVILGNRAIKISYPDNNQRCVVMTAADARSIEWTYTLNEQQQIESLKATAPASDKPVSCGVSFEYDDRGLLVKKVHDNGFQFDYRYDVFGNLTACLDNKGGGFTLVYDELNLPIEWHDSVGQSWLVERDKYGAIINIENPDGTFLCEATINATGESDCFNRVSANIRFPDPNYSNRNINFEDPSQIHYRPDFPVEDGHHNVIGQPTKLIAGRGANISECVYQYDSKGRLLEAHNHVGLVALSYNYRNQVISESFNGQAVEIQFNSLGRKTGFHVEGFFSLEYLYDELGRFCAVKYNGVTVIAVEFRGSTLEPGIIRCGDIEYPFSSGLLGADILSVGQASDNAPQFYCRALGYESLVQALSKSTENKISALSQKYRCDGFGRPVFCRQGGTPAVSSVADFIWHESKLVRQQSDLTAMDFIYHPVTEQLIAAVYENKVVFYRYNNVNEIVEVRDWEGNLVWFKASGQLCQYAPEIVLN